MLPIGNRPGGGGFAKALDLFRTLFQLANRLRSDTYDLVHINIPFRVRSLIRESLHLVVVRAFGLGPRTVVFFHGWDLGLGTSIERRPILSWAFRRLYDNVGLIFVLSEKFKSQLVHVGLSPVDVKVTTTMYQQILDIDVPKPVTDKPKILLISRFAPGKGVMIAARTAKHLLDSGDFGFTMILAGDGQCIEEVKRFVTESGIGGSVDLPGYVTGAQKDQLLREADIFLFPSQLQEGCPISILEAMGAGLAIVSTPRGAIPNVVGEGKNGFLLDTDDPFAFAGAIRHLLGDRALLMGMQAANREKAEGNYEVSDYSRRMAQAYRSVLGSD